MRQNPRRILVYGVTGCGKTTFAARIGQRLGLPVHEVDSLTWEPGWKAVPEQVQRARISDICSSDAWVLDSAYGAWIDVPLATADLIVALDYPRWTSLLRLVLRTIRRVATGQAVCNGNRETLKDVVSTDSIVVWHFRSFSRKRRRMRTWHRDPDFTPVVLLDSPRSAEQWLASLPA